MTESVFPLGLDELSIATANELDGVTGEVDPDYEGETGEGYHARLHNESASAINAIERTIGALVTPETFGAKGDLRWFGDATVNAGSKSLTSATAKFTAFDVGKTINIRGAGAAEFGGSMTTTIKAVTDETHAELKDPAEAKANGTVALYGTDDTQAWVEAFEEAVKLGVKSGWNYGRVRAYGRYMIAGAPRKGGTNKGYAQIPIPIMATTSATKFRLVLECTPGSAPPLYHWNQTAPQISGTTIFSPLINAAADGEYSVPSVIGGPTNMGGNDPLGGAWFSNMYFEQTGVMVTLMPRRANHMGMDLGLLAGCDINALSFLANDTTVELKNAADAKAYSSNGEAIRVPKLNNNDCVRIGSLSIEGFTYGLGFADHLIIDRLATIYCKVNAFLFTSGAATHGGVINNWSCEAGTTVLEVGSSAGARFPLRINRLDVEDSSGQGVDFVDPNNALRGTCEWGTDDEHRAPTVSGTEHFKITDNQNTA